PEDGFQAVGAVLLDGVAEAVIDVGRAVVPPVGHGERAAVAVVFDRGEVPLPPSLARLSRRPNGFGARICRRRRRWNGPGRFPLAMLGVTMTAGGRSSHPYPPPPITRCRWRCGAPASTKSRRRRGLWKCRFAWTTQTRCPHLHSRSRKKRLDF